MDTVKISCPGKIILMGEHAVVYGKPAIVAAVDKRMEVVWQKKNGNLEISAQSEIPIGVGMGFSAAKAVISAASLVSMIQFIDTKHIDKKLINEIAYEQEKINHGNPSGVDNTIATYGGILWFQKKDGQPVFKRLKIKNLPEFVLINTGKPKETTKEMVKNVKWQMANGKTKTQILNIFNQIEKATKDFLKALEIDPSSLPSASWRRSDLIKNCIRNCEMYLEELGVVGEFAKRIIREIEKIGGAAKISGAGGLTGGSGILLGYHQNPEKIFEIGQKFNLPTFKVKLGEEGVKIEWRK